MAFIKFIVYVEATSCGHPLPGHTQLSQGMRGEKPDHTWNPGTAQMCCGNPLGSSGRGKRRVQLLVPVC